MKIQWIGSPNYDTSRKAIDRLYKSTRERVSFLRSRLPRDFILPFSSFFMKPIMISNRHELQIFRSIIQFVVINMMNFLNKRIYFTTEMFFHNYYVNKSTPMFMSRVISHISPRGNRNSTFPIKMLFPFLRTILRQGFSIARKTKFRAIFGDWRQTINAFFNHLYIIPYMRITI